MGRLDWMLPAPRRVVEATPQQRVATGANGMTAGWDPIDGDYGFRPVGPGGGREVPERTREQARIDSVAGYRSNPMARAIIDTYVAFCVGDSGLTLSCTSELVRPHAEEFWNDPRNALAGGQELMLRSALLNGEAVNEMMVGAMTGVVRRNPIDPARVRDVLLYGGNPLWPEMLVIRQGAGLEDLELSVVSMDDLSGLLSGEVIFEPYFRAMETDRRGTPFLMPVLDWLDSYDVVLSNLIDRTALARFIAMDVTLKGDNADVDDFVAKRGGKQIPRSGTIEVHNESVEWKPLNTQTGSYEDVNTNKAVMTSVAAGAGLSKVWLAEPEDANRATSLTMAEPVRRRIGSVQNEWLARRLAMVRYAIDRKVESGTIPREVEIPGPAGTTVKVPASSTVSLTGPAIAAADAEVTAQVLVNLSVALDKLIARQVLTPEAAKVAARKGWTDYVGVPYSADLDSPDANPADVATHVEDTGGGTGVMNQLQTAA